VPPHAQAEVVRAAVRHPHVKGILAQKPLAMDRAEAAEIVAMCADAGIPLAVNQNMRFDHGVRALKALLTRGRLGDPVLATIEMRAVPHWQDYLRGYDRLTLLNMSIHHLDAFRFLFGEPVRVFASARSDPRTRFPTATASRSTSSSTRAASGSRPGTTCGRVPTDARATTSSAGAWRAPTGWRSARSAGRASPNASPRRST
jgi:predicted dehydrogenase